MNATIIHEGNKAFQLCTTVLVPTDQKSQITSVKFRDEEPRLLFNGYEVETLDSKHGSQTKITPQLLYICSDESIRKEEYYYDELQKTVRQALDGIKTPGYKKRIVATTDQSIGIVKYTEGGHCINAGIPVLLPRPSNDFIAAYCREQGKGFEKVLVEIVEVFDQSIGSKVRVTKDLYGFSKDSEVTIEAFNHRNDPNLIAFKEDDEYSLGFHINNLDISTSFRVKTAPDNTVTIRPYKEKTSWSREEIEKFIFSFNKFRKEAGDMGQNEPELILNWVDTNLK